jgi:hypothetical protein
MQAYTRSYNARHRANGFQRDKSIEREGDARQAGGALDASEDSADEYGIKAKVYEFSEHLWVAHTRMVEEEVREVSIARGGKPLESLSEAGHVIDTALRFPQ